MVVIFHGSFFTGHTVARGALKSGFHGVEYFFVLSGFVIYSAHAQDIWCPDRLLNYLNRRFLRIFPPYWLALSLVLLFIPITGPPGSLDPAELARNVFLLPRAAVDYPYVTPAWTLHYELCFYAAFCLLIVLPSVLGGALFVAWGIIVALMQAFGLQTSFPLSFRCFISCWNGL